MRLIPIIIMVFLLGGCASLNTKQSAVPVLKPHPVTNAYEKAFRCVGDMLNIYYSEDSPIVVAVRPILDETTGSYHSRAEIPAQITAMILTALNAVSPRIRFSEILIDGPLSEKAVLPHLILKGAITEFDRAETTESNGLDAGFSIPVFDGVEVQGDNKTIHALSRIALDLQAVEYPSQLSIPYVNSSLQTWVARYSSEQSWALSVYGLGIGNSVVKKQVDGAHEALRLTADLAVLQLIGRRFILPWHRCLPDDFVEDEVVRTRALTVFRNANRNHNKDAIAEGRGVVELHNEKATAEIEALGKEGYQRDQQVKMIQELLNYYGHLTLRRTGIWDPATVRVLDEVRRKHKFLWRETDRETIYWTLYANLPLNREIRDRVRQKEQELSALETPMDTALN
jgi:hypothetical protein